MYIKKMAKKLFDEGARAYLDEEANPEIRFQYWDADKKEFWLGESPGEMPLKGVDPRAVSKVAYQLNRLTLAAEDGKENASSKRLF